jgi:hypothetical protein
MKHRQSSCPSISSGNDPGRPIRSEHCHHNLRKDFWFHSIFQWPFPRNRRAKNRRTVEQRIGEILWLSNRIRISFHFYTDSIELYSEWLLPCRYIGRDSRMGGLNLEFRKTSAALDASEKVRFSLSGRRERWFTINHRFLRYVFQTIYRCPFAWSAFDCE